MHLNQAKNIVIHIFFSDSVPFALLSSGFMVSIGSADMKECAISFSGQRHAVATASAPYLSCIEIMVSNSPIVLLMSLLISFRIFLDFRLYLLKQLSIYNPFMRVLHMHPFTLWSISLFISLENTLLIFSKYRITCAMNILKNSLHFIIIPGF